MDSFRELKTDALNPESLYVTCPYNPSHRILRARLQYHLVKCKKNHKGMPEVEKVICPLDATHHVNKEELAEHMKVCPNRKIVDSERYLIDTEVSEPASLYKLPDMPPCEENWDDPNEEACFTYDPEKYVKDQPILRIKHGVTKSERKAFRQVERMKMIQFNSGQPMNTDEAAAAAGVVISNGRFIGRGRGVKPLGQEGLGPAKNKIDLERIVGDGVGRTIPVEVGPLRPPREQSIALRLAQCSLSDGNSSRESDDNRIGPSPRPSGQNSQMNLAGGNGKAGGFSHGKVESKPVSMENKKSPLAQDRWNQNNNISNKVNSSTVNLEEYKQKVQESKLAARMGLPVDDNMLGDEERARNFTYLDEEWQVQGRRGRVMRGAAAQSNRAMVKGRNF